MPPPGLPSLQDVADPQNLLAAFRRARRGKRHRPEVARFELRLESEIFALRHEILGGSYRPGGFRTFRVLDPVPRQISAAPFRDRVVHQALCHVIEPLLEPVFLPASYACRKGMGTHRALRAASYWARRHAFVLHADIRKFFPSIDHEVLLELLEPYIRDTGILALCRTIVQGSNPQEEVFGYFPGDDLFTPAQRRRGLPIGNLTSQLFANLMLHPIDCWFVQDLGHAAYLRYADDLLVFGEDRESLREQARELQRHLNPLRLRLHPTKTQVHRVQDGFRFLGFRIFPSHRRIAGRSLVRSKRKLRALCSAQAAGSTDMARVSASVRAWIAHARHGDTFRLRRQVLADLRF